MAFHPFQFFRKRQRTLLAILTVFAMFVFILSWGGRGDAFDTLMQWIGAKGGKDKTEVVTLDLGGLTKHTVTVSELDGLRQGRRMANAFMERAIMSADPSPTNVDREVVARVNQLLQFVQFAAQQPALLSMVTRQYEELGRDVQALRAQNKSDAARYAAFGLRLAGLVLWQVSHPGQTYFGGTLAADDLLDFMLWRRQADELGVTLTDEDVRKLVNHEADTEVLTGDQAKDAGQVGSMFRGSFKNATLKDVYGALRDEFRVRLAQQALLGTSPGARAALGTGLAGDEVPSVSTPQEFWEFYRDNRTQLRVTLLKLPVSQFTGQVKDAPTEDELRALFNRYKDVEPSPERKLPGFKVARRVKVGWAAADPSAAYYRQEAAKVMKVLGGARAVADLLSGAGSPGGLPGALTPLTVGLVPDPELQAEYEAYVKNMPSWLSPGHTAVPEGNSPYANDVRRPSTLASLVGQMAGVGGPWDVARAVAGSQAEAAAHQAEQAAHVASFVLAGTSPSVLGAVTQDAAFAHVRVQSLAAVRDALAERATEHLAPELAQGAVETFTKELDAKRFNPREAAEFVEKNANPDHGITAHDAMKEARDQAGIIEAPELEPLKKAVTGLTPLTLRDAREFAATFFQGSQLYHPERLPRNPGDTLYYYWLTENDKAYVPTFEEARAKVEAAWKFDKARELAKKVADEIAAEARTKQSEGISADRYARDEAARRGYEVFGTATPISRLVDVPEPGAPLRAATQYKPYQFEESKIPYPRPDTLDVLLKNLTKPGDATVIDDRPERNFYVAVLDQRTVPGEQEFYESYRKAPRGALLGDSLWARFQSEREEQYRTALVKEFRAKAGAPLDEQGTYRLDPEVRKRFSGRGGVEE